MISHPVSTCLAFAAVLLVSHTDAAEFETNAQTLGIVEGQDEPAQAQMTVDGLTLTVSASPSTLNDSNKGKTVGVSGNKTGQINADEQLALTFDRDVALKKIEINGVKENDDGSLETAVISIDSLGLSLVLSSEGVEPAPDGVSAKGSARVFFKGKRFVLPAGSTVVIAVGSEGSTFSLRSIEAEPVKSADTPAVEPD